MRNPTTTKINRREFSASVGALVLATVSGNFLSSCARAANGTVESIDLYLVNVTKERNFSHSTWSNRQHLFIGMKSSGHTGWGEVLVAKNELDFDIASWGSFMTSIKGLTIEDAIDFTRNKYLEGQWNPRQSEPILICLYDLMGKIAGKATLDIWDLKGVEAVPAVFTILEREVEKALIQAKIATEQGLTSHVKVKLFGEPELDLQLMGAMREYFGPETLLIGDPNRGYKFITDMDELAKVMIKLNEAGMDAVEDPSELSKEGWIELQSKVGKLALIPDHIMRPAHKAIELFSPEMGTYFNLHPNTMGSFVELNKLAAVIRASGKGLMVGDSSLVGPACTFWQQIAIGNGASWVEANEKPQESDIFIQCVLEQSTKINSMGKVELVRKNPGFGLAVDEVKLRKLSNKYADV